MDKEVIEHKLHEVFEFNSVKLKICLGTNCYFCYFFNKDKDGCNKPIGIESCVPYKRKDELDINFMKV